MTHYAIVEDVEREDGDVVSYQVRFTCEDEPNGECHLVCDEHEEYPTFEKQEDGTWACVGYIECGEDNDEECDHTDCDEYKAHPVRTVKWCNDCEWLNNGDLPDWVDNLRTLREGKHAINVIWKQPDEWPEWEYVEEEEVDPTPYSENFPTIADYERVNGPVNS